MQTDGRFVEHVQHADETGTDLRGETDALGLTTGEGARGAREGEVVESDVEQEAEPGLDLLEDLPGDRGLARAEDEAVEEACALGDRQVAHLGDGHRSEVARADRHGQDLGTKAGTGAGRARDFPHVAS